MFWKINKNLIKFELFIIHIYSDFGVFKISLEVYSFEN